jgi:predicted NBD/HSP70 family sugar kinase
VLPGHGRRHNRALILDELRQGPHSRADLARATQLTAATVGALVGGLLDEGIVEERGRRSAGTGKPATLLQIVPDARHVVGLDLSDARRFAGGVVNLVGDVVERRTVARRRRTGDAAVRLAAELVADLRGRTGRPVVGVGIGSPGVVFPEGVVQESSNLRWRDTPLAGEVGRGLDVPVHVVNDANAAVLAELRFGDATSASSSNLLVVKVGLGVGAGLVLDGQLIEGDGAAAGEIGHAVVDPAGAPCACGNRGCLEVVVAGSLLREKLDGLDEAGRAAVLTAAGDRLGIALAPVVSMLNLAEVLLSGPPDALGAPFRDAVVATVKQRTFPLVGQRFRVRPTSTGDDDVLLGAAAVVLERELTR